MSEELDVRNAAVAEKSTEELLGRAQGWRQLSLTPGAGRAAPPSACRRRGLRDSSVEIYKTLSGLEKVNEN